MIYNTLMIIRLQKRTILLAILVCEFLIGCTQTFESNKKVQTLLSMGVDYQLTQPDRIFRLLYELEEISGLPYFKDSIIVAVQDEKGKLFFYNKGKLLDDFRFGKDGDYEGVEVAGDKIYVSKSNGDMYEINTVSKKTKRLQTGLSTKNNIEGLTYDRLTYQFILACKDSPDLGEKKYKGKSFFAYDLADDKLVSKPLFHLSLKKIRAFLATQKVKIKVSQFKPSGIAIHPITEQTYVLAHSGKRLIVLNKEYQIVGISSLRHRLFVFSHLVIC